ncbi:MAG: hypothetical protein WC332_10635 [Clostridia bacterium]|jgi:hypothetical protein
MDAFLGWFFEFMNFMLQGVIRFFVGIFEGIIQTFNVVRYIEIFRNHYQQFKFIDWVFSILAIILMLAVWLTIILLIVFSIRRIIRLRKNTVTQESIFEEITDLHKEILRLNDEKDRILSLKVSQAGISAKELAKELSDITEKSYEKINQMDGVNIPDMEAADDYAKSQIPPAPEVVIESRFSKLIEVDQKYTYYAPQEYSSGFTLEQLCQDFRNFACSKMNLYYEIEMMRILISSMASTKLILLQGISGTGKTSLPYCFGKFLKNDATMASVQPSWRDRTELFGYFNEFTKKFNETEVLKRIYESAYNDDINMIVLDEMNIARVEYYFAEMLSVLEMPDSDQWKLELVPSSWPSDPRNLADGKLKIPENIWYLGTANNDDSTFAVSDKVYDRAFTINFESKGQPFDAPVTEARPISFSYLEELYSDAWEKYPVTKDNLDKIAKLDIYIIQKFRIAFGNRIMKQLYEFVPVYVACGGSEIDGIDYVLYTKVFRKFESLNLSLIREDLKELITYLSKSFGKTSMNECKKYLERLQRTY